MPIYKMLFWFDITTAMVVLGGFLFYLATGPVTAQITGAWLFVLAIVSLLMLAAIGFKYYHHIKTASVLLGIMAIPGIVFLVLMLAINIFGLKL